MQNSQEENEEIQNISDKTNNIDFQEFKTVPIGESSNSSVEIYNVYSGDYSKIKFKRRLTKFILFLIVIIIIFILFQILDISQIFHNEEDEFNKNKDNIGQVPDAIEPENYNDISPNKDDYFYIIQKKEKIDIEKFSSPQLRNPNNIKLIDKLEISLHLEFDKFIHFNIKDADNKRWEVPDKDILAKEYIINRKYNRMVFNKNNKNLDLQHFSIELLFNENIEENKNNSKEENIYDYFEFKLKTLENEEFFRFSTQNNFLFSDNYINFESKLTTNKIYGLGERSHDFELKEGTYTIWPQDPGQIKYDDRLGGMNLYGHQPIALHKSKYRNMWLGFVFLNTNAQDIVLSTKNNDTYLTHKTIGGIIDYYIIVDMGPEEILKDIQYLLGEPHVPPYWSLGLHLNPIGYKSIEEYKNVYEKYKREQIPYDVLWMDNGGFDSSNLDEKSKNMISNIKNEIMNEGGKIITNADMGFSYENADDKYIKLGEQLNIFIKSNYTKKCYIGKMRGKKIVFPDFLHNNISQFWNMNLMEYNNLTNYDGICLNMNEPTNLYENSTCYGEFAKQSDCTKDKNKYNFDELSYIPGYRKDEEKIQLSLFSISENALVSENNTIYNTKPLLSYYQGKNTFIFINDELKKRPFILSRSTSLGSGKYAFHWLGENLTNSQGLKNTISSIFNFGIFGIPMTASNICGFHEKYTQNLCLRWLSIGSFFPFSVNYNNLQSTGSSPWSFDKNSMQIIKKFINIRYSLLRYFYSQMFLIGLNEKGGFFKPLMMEFPDDEASYEDIEAKIMLGEGILLCPFYDEKTESKKFKFPNSTFNEYPNGKTIFNYTNNQQNNEVELSGDLDKIHLFVREGYIIPYQNVFDKYIKNTFKLREEKINLIVNVDIFKQSKVEIFFDNDGTDTIHDNYFFRVDIYYYEKKLAFSTFTNNIENYEFSDHILGKVEFWRFKELSIGSKLDGIIKLNVSLSENKYGGIFEAKYDEENDKVVFDFSKNTTFSLFNITEMEFIDV